MVYRMWTDKKIGRFNLRGVQTSVWWFIDGLVTQYLRKDILCPRHKRFEEDTWWGTPNPYFGNFHEQVRIFWRRKKDTRDLRKYTLKEGQSLDPPNPTSGNPPLSFSTPFVIPVWGKSSLILWILIVTQLEPFFRTISIPFIFTFPFFTQTTDNNSLKKPIFL